MTHSSASDLPHIEPPASFTVNPSGRIADGPPSGDVSSIRTPDRDVEMMVREEATGGHCLVDARDLGDDLDAVAVAFGILGVTA
jgi:hypothetical protein